MAEFGNFHAHVILKNLRPAGTKARGIPRGQLFELVSCANYTWELLAWLAFSIFTQTFTGNLKLKFAACIRLVVCLLFVVVEMRCLCLFSFLFVLFVLFRFHFLRSFCWTNLVMVNQEAQEVYSRIQGLS